MLPNKIGPINTFSIDHESYPALFSYQHTKTSTTVSQQLTTSFTSRIRRRGSRDAERASIGPPWRWWMYLKISAQPMKFMSTTLAVCPKMPWTYLTIVSREKEKSSRSRICLILVKKQTWASLPQTLDLKLFNFVEKAKDD